uniref:Protein ANTAGONIST OF LIKE HETEROCHROMATIN PROTEIN 1-like n=1 Tax=Crassostrea virginica TaxID=6565 RepID=A0A8B8AGH0_CRAVI|nr:protein ANTAGONIST OF LIKE HETEROCHROMATIN PROTEIN 1-like [Crassostrea virginica]
MEDEDINDEYDNAIDETAIVMQHVANERKIRQRIAEFFTKTVPAYSPDEFSSHFRMRRETFEEVCRQIVSTECFPTEHLNGREIIEPSKQVMISIWMLANMEGYRQISDRFNVTYSSVHRCFMRTCTALQSLSAEKIKWPTGAGANEIMEGFGQMKGFPRVIGAVDGCHIQIKTPQDAYHPMSYLNRKKDYSVILQAVCDHKLRFTDIVSGWPGSVHDARVFKNSELYSRSHQLFPGICIYLVMRHILCTGIKTISVVLLG